MATRAQVLLLLRPLIPDVQRKIMSLIFPTFDTIHELIKRFAYEPLEWEEMINDLTIFAHSDDRKMRVRLRGEDVRFVEHCCKHLQFDCFDANKFHDEKATHVKPLSVFQAPEKLKWPRSVELTKPVNWVMRSEVPDSLNSDFDPDGDVCEHCESIWTTWDKTNDMFLCPDCWDDIHSPDEFGDEFSATDMAIYMDYYGLDEYDLCWLVSY